MRATEPDNRNHDCMCALLSVLNIIQSNEKCQTYLELTSGNYRDGVIGTKTHAEKSLVRMQARAWTA